MTVDTSVVSPHNFGSTRGRSHSPRRCSLIHLPTSHPSSSPCRPWAPTVGASGSVRRLLWSTCSPQPRCGSWPLQVRPGGASWEQSWIQLTAAKRSLHRSAVRHDDAPPPGIAYKNLTVGVPRETYPSENRVAVTPAGVATLLKKGFGRVLVESGSGSGANFPDDAYAAAGASIVDGHFDADITLKVRPPTIEQAAALNPESTLISFLYPAVNKDLVEVLRKGGVNALAMDAIPRTSRAQTFDALSSMANTAGYRAVLEAGNEFGRFFTGQVTAAGKIPPAKVLVIGGGVAGLSAIATARRMGAVVRGFDTRPVVKEQVESLGAEFLTVEIEEDGSGSGGYAKEMSKVSSDFRRELTAGIPRRRDGPLPRAGHGCRYHHHHRADSCVRLVSKLTSSGTACPQAPPRQPRRGDEA